MQKTYWTRPADVERRWYVVDAEGQTLGRMASKIATVLKGKHKTIYNPAMDTGDYVIVINADKIHVTGRRREQKRYYHHSGYLGGLKEITLEDQLKKHPTRVVHAAVKGMLPKNALGRRMIKKLKLYTGSEHPHEAQLPVPLDL